VDDRRRAARGRSIPWGFLGMVALVVVLEVSLVRQERFLTEHAACWRAKGLAASREAAACEVLCLGDSQVEFGVLPRVIEARLGADARAYNLALHAGPPAATYFLLRRALDAGAKPRAVVVDFTPRQLARPPGHDEPRHAWPDLASPGEAIDLASSTADPDLATEIWAGQVVASTKSRHEIRASIVKALAGQGFSFRPVTRLVRRNWQSNLGAHVLPEGGRTEAVPDPTSSDLFDAWSCDPATARYVDRFLRLACARGIAVFWLLPPISPEFQARRDRLGLEAPYDAFLRARQAEFPGLVVVDGRHSGYGVSLFVDAIHLDRRGATALSDDLARRLAGPEGGPRWSELAPPHVADHAPLVEDLEESKVALGYKKAPARR